MRFNPIILAPAIILFFSANAFTESCPDKDPTWGGTHSNFIQATLLIGVFPQYPQYKAEIICSYKDNLPGNVYPYTSIPNLTTPSNWQGPKHIDPVTLYFCKKYDALACAYDFSS